MRRKGNCVCDGHARLTDMMDDHDVRDLRHGFQHHDVADGRLGAATGVADDDVFCSRQSIKLHIKCDQVKEKERKMVVPENQSLDCLVSYLHEKTVRIPRG